MEPVYAAIEAGCRRRRCALLGARAFSSTGSRCRLPTLPEFRINLTRRPAFGPAARDLADHSARELYRACPRRTTIDTIRRCPAVAAFRIMRASTRKKRIEPLPPGSTEMSARSSALRESVRTRPVFFGATDETKALPGEVDMKQGLPNLATLNCLLSSSRPGDADVDPVPRHRP